MRVVLRIIWRLLAFVGKELVETPAGRAPS